MAETRDDRRRRVREEERRRQAEVDKLLEEAPLPAFEAPATGIIVDEDLKRKPPGRQSRQVRQLSG